MLKLPKKLARLPRGGSMGSDQETAMVYLYKDKVIDAEIGRKHSSFNYTKRRPTMRRVSV